MECVALGHELVCVANLYPADKKEKDSYMYQSVGVDIVPHIARCLDVPIYRAELQGKPHDQEMYYAKSKEDDEVEDLFKLLVLVKEKHPEI